MNGDDPKKGENGMTNLDYPNLTAYGRQSIGVLGDSDRWGMLILPGGGYHCHAPAEAEPTALAFAALGVQTFVLRYPVAPSGRWPDGFLAAAGAMEYLRAHAAELGFSPNKLAVCGFSAGGHLAGCLTNLFDHPLLRKKGLTNARPDASVLCYPVITGKPPFGHAGSFLQLLGGKEIPPELNLEDSVPLAAPPVFLWCTGEDDTVPAENSLFYANALRKNQVPFEFHYFQKGPHAMGVATADSAFSEAFRNDHAACWVGLCADWLKKLSAEGESGSNAGRNEVENGPKAAERRPNAGRNEGENRAKIGRNEDGPRADKGGTRA